MNFVKKKENLDREKIYLKNKGKIISYTFLVVYSAAAPPPPPKKKIK